MFAPILRDDLNTHSPFASIGNDPRFLKVGAHPNTQIWKNQTQNYHHKIVKWRWKSVEKSAAFQFNFPHCHHSHTHPLLLQPLRGRAHTRSRRSRLAFFFRLWQNDRKVKKRGLFCQSQQTADLIPIFSENFNRKASLVSHKILVQLKIDLPELIHEMHFFDALI